MANVIPATRTAQNRSGVFSYEVPETLSGQLKVGMIVLIPFGNREVNAAVIEIIQAQHLEFKIKPIKKIVWEQEIFTPQLIKLAFFISDRYVVSLGLVVKTILTKTAIRPRLSAIVDNALPEQEFKLNKDQSQAVADIKSNFDIPTNFLLFGVTGSGKTEVYMHVIKELIKLGKQTLMLVPEISLTPQTSRRFVARFPGQVAVVHSKISYGQKFKIWNDVYAGKIKILIGPRSAIFAPFKNLGIIILDEEHDSSYKQFDQNPKFHTREVAQELSRLWTCPLIFGDATPSVESFYRTEHNLARRLELPQRIHQELPPVTLVDMRQEAIKGNFSIFSDLLIKRVVANLEKSMQIILFINRLGTATSVICRDCGNPLLCSRCEVTLVYHRSRGMLVCHHCLRTYPVPLLCPHCASSKLQFIGTGTEKVEYHIAQLFPQARVARFDSQTIANKKNLEKLYEDFTVGRFDILVGTQILARGWDLSTIGLIGVINTDTILQLPDFRSNERTFQLITQVAGRTGRGKFPGEVVLQTFTPDNFAIKAAVTHDYKKFYAQEILQRKEYDYPPYSRLIKLTIRYPKQERALAEAEGVASKIRATKEISEEKILGPAPAFIPRRRGLYVYYVIIKLPVIVVEPIIPGKLLEILRNLPPNWDIDVDPESVL